ncbi:MAG: hypothetical protein JNM75_13320 [Rhodospirillales bacterium]|nr:hypothetical protein [Rhodospirillales bacterium]
MSSRRSAAAGRTSRASTLVSVAVAAVVTASASADPAGAAEARVPGTTTWLLSYNSGESFCLAHAYFPRSGIGLGFVSDGEALGVGLVNTGWHLRERSDYDVGFRFDGKPATTARFVATDAIAMASELDAAAEAEFRDAATVEVVADDGRTIGRLSLSGSARAIDYVRTCGMIAGGR